MKTENRIFFQDNNRSRSVKITRSFYITEEKEIWSTFFTLEENEFHNGDVVFEINIIRLGVISDMKKDRFRHITYNSGSCWLFT